jgi:hypothetical protein
LTADEKRASLHDTTVLKWTYPVNKKRVAS